MSDQQTIRPTLKARVLHSERLAMETWRELTETSRRVEEDAKGQPQRVREWLAAYMVGVY